MNTIRKCVAVVGIALFLATPAAVFAGFPDDWNKDAANPISTDFWGSTVIFHDGIYKAWSEGVGGIDYATSPDGRTWTKHPASPVLLDGPEWYDVNGGSVPSVVIVGGEFNMFYSCVADIGNNRIAHATSPDGIVWTKDPANPVMDLGQPGNVDSNELIHPCVVYEAPVFRIWYNSHTDAPGDTPQNIAHATSFDGVTWARYPQPVLEPGSPGEWDGIGLFMMNVVLYQDLYYMFYTGGQGDGMGDILPVQIGYATSPDGVNWARRNPSEPVLRFEDSGGWDSGFVGAPVVMATETGFRMWYGGGVDLDHIFWGLATSDYPPRPVFQYGPYFPLYLDATWHYQSVENGANTRVESVCCPESIGGEPALLYDINGEYQVACRKEGPTITYYGYYESTVFNDFVPDLVLDTFQDGSIIAYPCDTSPCEQFELVRVWTELDHPDLGIYDIDPSYDDLIVFAHYSGGTGTSPNHQNEIMESNLPPGTTPPPGAVTDLGWRQRGVGVVATIGVSASTGDLEEKYVLVDLSPVSDDVPAGKGPLHLHQNSPNPFNPQTTIAYDLPKQTAVSLRVFDVSGRLVRVLVDGEIVAEGRNEAVWNGRDDTGRQVASGTYFYRLEAGEYSETKRMALIK
jgi:predicted GH43/DUF377 family glycosyl hydrolase